MRNAIKAKTGYHIVAVQNIVTGEKGHRVDDGNQPLFVAIKRSYEDFKDEHEQNEMFNLCEVFTTEKGNQFICWRDEEIDRDYITKVQKEEQQC